VHAHKPGPRVPRTIGGISDALRGSRRAQFFAELLQAEHGPDLDGVLAAWWGRAMLDSDPERAQVIAAAGAGTLAVPGMPPEDLADLEDAAALEGWRAREEAGETSYMTTDEVRRRLGLPA
jgi:hypothetical protein